MAGFQPGDPLVPDEATGWKPADTFLRTAWKAVFRLSGHALTLALALAPSEVLQSTSTSKSKKYDRSRGCDLCGLITNY